MLVEGLGLIGNRVHEQGPHANRPGSTDHLEYGVAEQRRTEPTALPAPVDRQPSEQRDWYRIRHIAAHTSGRRVMQNGTCRQAVIPDDSSALGDDVSA